VHLLVVHAYIDEMHGQRRRRERGRRRRWKKRKKRNLI
jgi:hypothetical protein